MTYVPSPKPPPLLPTPALLQVYRTRTLSTVADPAAPGWTQCVTAEEGLTPSHSPAGPGASPRPLEQGTTLVVSTGGLSSG